MKRPETGGEIVQFSHAVNWMRTVLPRLAEVLEPFRRSLAEHMVSSPRQTKSVTSNQAIKTKAWTAGIIAARTSALDFVAHAVVPSDGRVCCTDVS